MDRLSPTTALYGGKVRPRHYYFRPDAPLPAPAKPEPEERDNPYLVALIYAGCIAGILLMLAGAALSILSASRCL